MSIQVVKIKIAVSIQVVKIKIAVSIEVIKITLQPATKAQRGSRSIALLFL